MTVFPAPPASVAAVLDGYPSVSRQHLMAVRTLIFTEADRRDVGPLTETLKWGEPAYLTEASRAGTTIRLAWKPASPENLQLLVHCTTSLIDAWRGRFPGLAFAGNRALLLPLDAQLPRGELAQMIGMALTYHRR